MKTTPKSKPTDADSASEETDSNNALRELLLDELTDLHSAERQLVKALPKLAKNAKSEELRTALEEHLEETETHVNRLEQAAEALGESLGRKKCKGMEGLIAEGEELIEELEDSPASDAGIIASAQKTEHYEIAAYGTVLAWAKRLGEDKVTKLLAPTLDEEKAADEKLTAIAEELANHEATAQE